MGSRVPGHEQPTSDACEERERGLARHQRCVFVSPPFIREIFLKREYFFYYLKCEHRPLVLSHRLLPARRQKALVVGELGSWTTLAPFPPTPSHTHTHTHTPPRTHTHTHTHTPPPYLSIFRRAPAVSGWDSRRRSWPSDDSVSNGSRWSSGNVSKRRQPYVTCLPRSDLFCLVFGVEPYPTLP